MSHSPILIPRAASHVGRYASIFFDLSHPHLFSATAVRALAPPGERRIEVHGALTHLKLDVRACPDAGQVQLLAVRMYAGQTTNFRTQGGGSAPVMVVPNIAIQRSIF